MITTTETTGARLLRQLRLRTEAYKREAVPVLPHDRKRALAEHLDQLERLAESHMSLVDGIAAATELSAEGRRQRITAATEKSLGTLGRLDGERERLMGELDQLRGLARRGLITPQGRREVTPADQQARTLDLLLRLPDKRRADVYREAVMSNGWDVVDAVESAASWAGVVPADTVRGVQQAREQAVPAVRTMTRELQAREDCTTLLRRQLAEAAAEVSR